MLIYARYRKLLRVAFSYSLSSNPSVCQDFESASYCMTSLLLYSLIIIHLSRTQTQTRTFYQHTTKRNLRPLCSKIGNMRIIEVKWQMSEKSRMCWLSWWLWRGGIDDGCGGGHDTFTSSYFCICLGFDICIWFLFIGVGEFESLFVFVFFSVTSYLYLYLCVISFHIRGVWELYPVCLSIMFILQSPIWTFCLFILSSTSKLHFEIYRHHHYNCHTTPLSVSWLVVD